MDQLNAYNSSPESDGSGSNEVTSSDSFILHEDQRHQQSIAKFHRYPDTTTDNMAVTMGVNNSNIITTPRVNDILIYQHVPTVNTSNTLPVRFINNAIHNASVTNIVTPGVVTLCKATDVFVECRSIRFGSFKYVPQVEVAFSPQRIRIVCPTVDNEKELVEVDITIKDIVRISAHFPKRLMVLFIETTTEFASLVQSMLRMNVEEGIFFSPDSTYEHERRVILLPDNLNEEDKNTLRNMFSHTNLFGDPMLVEVDHNTANDILVRSAPPEVRKLLGSNRAEYNEDNSEVILNYPPDSVLGRVIVRLSDYERLAPEVFFNDIIIDFFLQYIFHTLISEEERQRTYIFSTYFYDRLSQEPTALGRLTDPTEDDPTLTPAEKQHHRVKRWTKKIDIFEKDFIIIPINDNQVHWFVAIICFPGHTKCTVSVTSQTPPIPPPPILSTPPQSNIGGMTITVVPTDDKKVNSLREVRRVVLGGTTTITPLAGNKVKLSENNMPKAEAILEVDLTQDDESGATSVRNTIPLTPTISKQVASIHREATPKTPSPRKIKVKQPCILIFDSLGGPDYDAVISKLRDYLFIEHRVKKGFDRDFSENLLKSDVPDVPQQDNGSDCGLFVLQYVQSFFENPIDNYNLPITHLNKWFPQQKIKQKRKEIMHVIQDLMKEQDMIVNLPEFSNRPIRLDDNEEESDYESGELEDEDPATQAVVTSTTSQSSNGSNNPVVTGRDFLERPRIVPQVQTCRVVYGSNGVAHYMKRPAEQPAPSSQLGSKLVKKDPSHPSMSILDGF